MQTDSIKAKLMRMRQHGLYFFIVTIIMLLVTGLTVYILTLNYDSLIAFIVAGMQKNGLEDKLRNHVFTEKHFLLLQRLCYLLLVLLFFCAWLAIRFRVLIIYYCRCIIAAVKESLNAVVNIYKKNSFRENLAFSGFMIILIIICTFHMLSPYMTYDEMWSYNYYTSAPFYYSFFTYCSYPLFEFSTQFFKWLPFPMHVNLRLSPFIFGIASCFLLYACLRKYFCNHFTAMAGLLVFALTPLVFLYMVNARGVMHELFFAIAGLFSCLFWLNDTAKKKYLAIFAIAGVAGLYSMTTHLLFLIFILVMVFFQLLKKDRPALFLFVKINLFILIVFSLLYAPILLTTGAAVYKEVIVKAPPYLVVLRNIPVVMMQLLVGYTARATTSLILLAAMLLLLFFQKGLPAKMKFLSVFTVLLPVSLIIFYFITRFVFAGRAVAFGVLTIPLLACLFVQIARPWLVKVPSLVNTAAIALAVLFIVLDSYLFLPVRPIHKYMYEASGIFLRNKIATCYDNTAQSDAGFFYYYPAIEYYYRLQHKSFEFTLSAKNSMRYKPLLAEDAYDCIVYDMGATDSRLKNYHEMYRDPLGKFIVWVRNDIRQ